MAIRTIKKYPNRRLYDTELSRYITVADVRELVMKHVDFKVMDANTKEDITRNTLMQIIIEQEAGGEPLFTNDVLSRMIRFYGDTAQDVFTNYLERSTALFVEQQRRVQDQVVHGVFTNPVSAMAELTQRNLELWRDIQDSFIKTAYSPSKEGNASSGTKRKNRDER